jgi:uncharacterized protein YpuA (DUF1002 family)
MVNHDKKVSSERGDVMKKGVVCLTIVIVLAMLIVQAVTPYAYSQERLSDKDIETMFNNLKSDTKKFGSTFNSAIGKSTIRKTSQEKEAKALVQSFGKQSEAALNKFKKNRQPDVELSNLLASGVQINQLLASTPMGDRTDADWSKVKSLLSGIATQFNKEFPAK